MRSSAVTPEPTKFFDVLSNWESLSFNSKGFHKWGLRESACNVPDVLSFDGFGGFGGKPKVVASLGVSRSSFRIQRFWNEFNRAVRLHCGGIPIGFSSISVNSSDNGLKENGETVLGEEELSLNGVGRESPKKVLILMSDTGGGHRASAEAIKAAFNEAFGEEYQVFITDLWTDHTPWPFNQLPRSYNFLVKHGTLWKMTYYGTAPRVVHQSNFAATSMFIARYHFKVGCK
ncbi:hypothetical protein Scep_023531 [Stephania cephalantha]|uniref:Diacylglycerol glucosyltransferase N-terminal domain-containing protein n=1 Tax=Stephania cephalantha TaxID=152367 RepID=A0AAP0EUU7_9MAGN